MHWSRNSALYLVGNKSCINMDWRIKKFIAWYIERWSFEILLGIVYLLLALAVLRVIAKAFFP